MEGMPEQGPVKESLRVRGEKKRQRDLAVLPQRWMVCLCVSKTRCRRAWRGGRDEGLAKMQDARQSQ